jgi:hypothetical protein
MTSVSFTEVLAPVFFSNKFDLIEQCPWSEGITETRRTPQAEPLPYTGKDFSFVFSAPLPA